MANIRRDVYGIGKPMRKQASGLGALLPTAANVFNAAGGLTSIGAAYLVAAAVTGGAGIGWLASQATAKGKQDYSTAQKGYENEALSSDIGYFTSKIKQERDARRLAEQPKPMRVF